MWRIPSKFSECELDYLKSHLDESVNQLSGYLGKSRASIKRQIDILNGKIEDTKQSRKRTKIGKRKDLDNKFFRSGWEASTARYFKFKGINWEYEPEVFVFKNIKHGTVSYCPDFRIEVGPSSYKWVEIKGQLKSSDKARIRRFKKYYPEEFDKLQCIVGNSKTKAALFFKEMNVPVLAYYQDLNKQYKDVIPNWE